MDYVQAVAAMLKTKGRVPRAWLGLSTARAPLGPGALVVAVEHDGRAERAGIAPGDVVVRIGEKQVSHPQDARGVVIGADPGTHVPIDILRNGNRAAVDVQLATIPVQPARR